MRHRTSDLEWNVTNHRLDNDGGRDEVKLHFHQLYLKQETIIRAAVVVARHCCRNSQSATAVRCAKLSSYLLLIASDGIYRITVNIGASFG